ncbi:copper-binding protein [Nitrosomonas communis]|uniref:Membrane fusion protein, Cu(I)/Ag(I) efflux system/membrane fusion protein, cobalt-zinc-cadmium efflux system n=1 Tax=Nitrosomonas communis TaxID=44574 RepID=A0A1I4NR48_9PROT|nr:copper-binding protein [Nitrosomonas communis]SFM17613.1 membrane fusion protein, Cu(I)/Ag(I) efflux system/membrane fusion protein, cobalt-zinc-cadmium efflux system [Nitrosomonas communis]
MKRNVMSVFVSVCVVFVLAGLITMQFADAGAVSHEGTATVKAIELDKNIVKLAHGPIASLKWPAMVMNFKVKDHALMQGIKVGDSVTFTFIQSNGDYMVTHIQPDK